MDFRKLFVFLTLILITIIGGLGMYICAKGGMKSGKKKETSDSDNTQNITHKDNEDE